MLNQEKKNTSKSVDGEETCKILSPVLSGRNGGHCQSNIHTQDKPLDVSIKGQLALTTMVR